MLARRALLDAGHVEVAEADAELHVINTCCITNEAESKSRQAVRRSLKTARQVYVAGCAVNLNATQFARHRRSRDPVRRHRGRGRGHGRRLRRPRARRARSPAGPPGPADARLHQGPGRLRLALRVLHHPQGPRRRPFTPVERDPARGRRARRRGPARDGDDRDQRRRLPRSRARARARRADGRGRAGPGRASACGCRASR